MKNRIFNYLFSCLCLLVQANLWGQQNDLSEDRIIYCWPTTSIVIDGDLSDWPTNTVRFPIAKKLWGVDLDGANDFSGHFQTAYDLKKNELYVGVVIEDDEAVLAESDPNWTKQDSYSLFLNEKYERKGSGIAHFSFAENFKDTGRSDNHWDKEMVKYQDWGKVSHKVSRMGNTTVFEVAIRLEKPITIGRIIGIGHWFYDVDAGGRTSVGWIGRGGKPDSAQPGRIGMLVFADENLPLGSVSGKLKWKETTINSGIDGAYIVSETDPAFWVQIPSDKEQNFSVTLPIGKYKILPDMKAYFAGDDFYRPDFSVSRSFEIKPNKTNDIGTYYFEALPNKKLDFKGNVLLNLNKSGKKKIDQTIEAYLEQYEIEGATFAAWENGKIIYAQQYGVSNNYTGEKVNRNTLFEVASITKPVFAFTVMRLYEKGLIDLDKPLNQYLAFDLIKDHEYAGLITARHVLSHQTGFPNWAWGGNLEFKFKPGTDFGYSGEGYEYLKRVIEKITGKPINQVFQEELVRPLGLEHFYFQEAPYAYQHKSHGHRNSYPGKIDLPRKPWVAGGLVTKPTAFMKFAEAIHQRKGLKPETYELMFSEQIGVPEQHSEGNWDHPEHMGLGWFVENAPYGKVFRHSGNNGDFQSMFRLYDDLGMAYLLITNGNSGFYLINQLEKVLIDPKKFPLVSEIKMSTF